MNLLDDIKEKELKLNFFLIQRDEKNLQEYMKKIKSFKSQFLSSGYISFYNDKFYNNVNRNDPNSITNLAFEDFKNIMLRKRIQSIL